MHEINAFGAETFISITEGKAFQLETIGEESVADAVLRCQVLPTVIQMAVPQHRQWGCTTTHPGETDIMPAHAHIEFRM